MVTNSFVFVYVTLSVAGLSGNSFLSFPELSNSTRWGRAVPCAHIVCVSMATYWGQTGWINVVSTQLQWNYIEPTFIQNEFQLAPAFSICSILVLVYLVPHQQSLCTDSSHLSTTHSLTHSLSHIQSHIQSHVLTHSVTRSHTFSHSRSHIHTHSLTHSHTFTLTHSLSHIHSHTFTLPHSHTHARSNAHTNTHHDLYLYCYYCTKLSHNSTLFCPYLPSPAHV